MADEIRGTYKIYKDATNMFLSWLAETAKSRGHKFQSETNTNSNTEATRTSKPRLKGKARKAAREAASKAPQQPPPAGEKHQLSLKDFTACAETPAKTRDPVVLIPSSIRAIAVRALALRKRCANWFARQVQTSEETLIGNFGYRYFNNWLEDILSILKPCGDVFDTEVNPQADAKFDLGDRFSSLSIEEPSPEWMAPLKDKPTETPLPSSSSARTGTSYSWKSNDEDKYLAIFCLYEDLNHLHQQICHMWTKYRLGELDLVTVSVVTNVAL